MTITRVVVVVPVRDEEATLGDCLDSVLTAAAAVAVPVEVVVVLNGCTDASTGVAAARPVRVLATRCGGVGAARASGVDHALTSAARESGGGPDDEVWVACTDADSVVPPRWLSHQLALADAGADLVLGTVDLLTAEPNDPVAQSWRRRYHQAIRASDDHPHVHGANLGVRASAYLAVGGFPDVSAHEDVALAWAVTQQGTCAIVRTAAVPVLTSPRLRARAPEGLAQDLRGIADDLEALEPAS